MREHYPIDDRPMNDHCRFRERIPTVSPGTPQPLWSVMIPTFHCAAYLGQTLVSVLSQAPASVLIQIEVVDDHSTSDDPESVVAEVGQGRVEFFRQQRNIGVPANLNTCLRRSRGRLVHVLHGDDYVREGFYAKMQAAFAEHSDLGAAFCRHIYMDEDGHWIGIADLEQRSSGVLPRAIERLAAEQRIMTPSMVVRREIYERLGGFDSRLACAEDWEMWVRIAATYPIWYEVEPLAAYRMHSRSNTGRHIRTAEDIRYTRGAIDLFRSYLPADVADAIYRRARETYAAAALKTAHQLRALRDWPAMNAQVREALRLSHSPRTLCGVVRLAVLAAASAFKPAPLPY
jgi:glycosyltransferase involved in cell wall biosynthesis